MDVVLDHLPLYLRGMRTTVALTLWSYAAALVLGGLTAAMRVSPVRPLRSAAAFYVETVRNTPLPVLLLLFFFGFPKLGVIYSPFVSAVLMLALYTGAFAAEIVRSGINTVGVGQVEAARSLGLSFNQLLGEVVLPQALRSVVPPMGTLFIALTKNSSLASLISVPEIMFRADQVTNDTARPTPALIGAALTYLALTLPSTFGLHALERRLAIKR
ncbi:MAG: amino acid ABC transporter permease [Acidimicrobiales bacterium]